MRDIHTYSHPQLAPWPSSVRASANLHMHSEFALFSEVYLPDWPGAAEMREEAHSSKSSLERLWIIVYQVYTYVHGAGITSVIACQVNDTPIQFVGRTLYDNENLVI